MNSLLLLSFFSLSAQFPLAQASDYPPGYAITRECKAQENFEVCLINRYQGTFPRIEIRYEGRLVQGLQTTVNVWIKNQHGQTFYKPLFLSPWSKPVVIFNDPKAGKCFAKPYGTSPTAELPPLTGQYAWCLRKVQDTPQSQTLVWEAHEASLEERDFVKSLFHAHPFKIEVAAFNENGEWDSRYGHNFHFTF